MKNIGNITRYHYQNKTLIIEAENINCFIQIIDNQIPRVEYSLLENIDTHSFTIDSFNPTEFEYDDNGTIILIQIPNGKIHINKYPLKISFLNNQNQIVSADNGNFETTIDGKKITNFRTINENEKFIGLGEKTGKLNKRGTQLINWNTDQFAYGLESDPLYASIPFYISIKENSISGIFLDNPGKSTFNFGASNHLFTFIQTENANLTYYFFYGEHIQEILNQYQTLTGKMPLPPMWSLGYQQCRYSYYPQEEITTLADQFRNKKVPCDVLYFDIHYMDNYKVFTWHPKFFPNPQYLNQQLMEKGFKTVAIIDPGIKIENGYEAYEEALKEDLFIKYPNGILYEGEAWPGKCHFPDFTQQKTIDYWSSKIAALKQIGISGFWIDMNEPAVWGKNFPDNTVHQTQFGTKYHNEIHNVYGMTMAKATQKGAANASERPFVLTRSGYAGIQKYAALWTGDNSSSDEQMLLSVRMTLGLSLSGIFFTGSDIGGFCGECSPRLFARWIALGAFLPFFRSHTMINSKDAEPWSFGEEVEDIARNFIQLRYRLLPYLYHQFYLASAFGIPICRPLAYENPKAEKSYIYENQFFTGDSILICPVDSIQNFTKVFLPDHDYFDFYTDTYYQGNQEYIIETPIEKIPVFVKMGSIIFAQNVIQHTNEKPSYYEIHIYCGINCNQSWFIDDGKNTNNNHAWIHVNWNEETSSLQLSIENENYELDANEFQIYFHSKHDISNVSLNGIPTETNSNDYQWIEQISNFDPYVQNTPFKHKINQLKSVKIKL
jgi:alpha-glucosidase